MAARQQNGLTLNEDLALRHALRQVEALKAGYAYLGGNERSALDTLARDLKTRVDPADAETLTARAEELLQPLTRDNAWARRALEGLT